MAQAAAGALRVFRILAVEAVADAVDLVFIANESGDGRDHLKLATPGLEKGVPTFVDRPFARTVKDAKAMIAPDRPKRRRRSRINAPIAQTNTARNGNSVTELVVRGRDDIFRRVLIKRIGLRQMAYQ